MQRVAAPSSKTSAATPATKNSVHSRPRRSTPDSATTARLARGATIPTRTSSGWSADSTSFIHAIHAADKRDEPFTWHASTTTESFANIGYPGILNKCETCHLPGTYDFSASASAAAADNRLYRYVATGTVLSSTATALQKFSASPYVTAGTNYGAGFSFNAATGVTVPAADTTLVTSPTATVCFACHDHC